MLLLYSRGNYSQCFINNVVLKILLATIVIVNVENTKDERLELVNIPRGFIESLNNAGITIEMILNSKPADIAEILGIDDYVANIIYQETKYCYQTTDLLK
jgi:hypothetical protein